MTVGIVTLAGFTMTPPPPPEMRVAVDSFSRAAGADLGVTEFGGFAWSTIPSADASKWAIASTGVLQKVAGQVPTSPNLCVINSGASDGTIKVTTLSGLTVGQGLVFRSDASAANLFLLSRVTTTGEWSLRRRTGGTYSYLWQEGSSPTGAAGDVAKVILNGPAIKVYVNDVLKWSGTDAQGVTNTVEGLWASSSAVCSFDAFEHTKLTA